MLTKIKLIGELGRRFGREYNLAIRTPAEAIVALSSQIPGFAAFIYDHPGVWRVVAGEAIGLTEEGLHHHHRSPVVVIAPIVAAAGGFGRILLGAALIGAAFLVPGGFLGLSATQIGLMGGALLFGGISSMLSKKTKSKKDQGRTDSSGFGSVESTGAQGGCMPVVYGEYLVPCSIVVSAGVAVNEWPI